MLDQLFDLHIGNCLMIHYIFIDKMTLFRNMKTKYEKRLYPRLNIMIDSNFMSVAYPVLCQ